VSDADRNSSRLGRVLSYVGVELCDSLLFGIKQSWVNVLSGVYDVFLQQILGDEILGYVVQGSIF